MFELLSRNWWSVALRGLCALLFGLATIAWPGATLASLALLFGIYAIADGTLALAALFEPAPTSRRWALALHGLVSILAGTLAFIQPGTTALAFVYLIATWAILTGISTIVAAIELRKAIDNEWLLGLSGAVALLFGIEIAVYPGIGTLVLLSMIAAYAIIAGMMQIALGLRLRRLNAARQQAGARR
ncbi:MAG TPA: HdeD family acid-resistance protein [Roseiflexaceae bacterium]|nr:HdeD family acid-resistance protein [Roseiflexaceae bacterium]